MSTTNNRKLVDDFEKHRTGRQSSTKDFVKHDCANKVEVWENGKKVQKAITVKKEFSKIKGNENMVPINTMASDSCPYCGLSVTDKAMVDCTDDDVEALSK